ncbi:MAG: hypothetical protein ACOC0W_01010 [Desulfosalsimonas sp.]
MYNIQWQNLTRFGFKPDIGGAHTARTMMLEDLTGLLNNFKDPNTSRQEYLDAIIEDNCLSKRSYENRKITARRLAELYALDPSVLLFRVLRFFWDRDIQARPLLGLLCTYCRDEVFRTSCPFVFELDQGEPVTREKIENFIKKRTKDRFTKSTLKSVAQNVNSTFTQSGHLQGRAKKYRTRATASPGAAAYALLLGYLTGGRGQSLFETEFAKLLDCSMEEAMDLAGQASQRGWITFKRIGSVIEVLFPQLLNEHELELIREQG